MDNIFNAEIENNTELNAVSRFRLYSITFILSFSLFIALTGEGIVVPVFPLYLGTFSGRAFDLGLLIVSFATSSLIFAPIVGSLADRFGRKIFIVLGLLAFAIANILYTQAQSFDQLLFFRILEGASAAGSGPIVNAMLIDYIPKNKKGRYLGLVNGSGFLGLIIGPFIGGLLVQHNNYALPFDVSALVALFGMALALLILPNDYKKFRNKKREKTEHVFKIGEHINFRNWIVEGTALVFIITLFIRFANNVSWALIEPSISFYLYSYNYSSIAVGLYFSCFGITMFIGQSFLGGLSDKFGRKPILQIGVLIYLIGFLSMLNTHSIIIFYISSLLNGIGGSFASPAIVSLIADVTNDESNNGKVMGYFYGVLYLSGIVGPFVGGYLGDKFGFNFVLSIAVVILILGLVSSFFIHPLKLKKDSEVTEQAVVGY